MRKVWAIIRRELIAYFSSPLAYIVMTAFLLMQGYIFYLIVSFLNNPQTPAMTPLRLFFGGTIFFWLFLLFVVPVITMRLIAEERRSGTIEVLLTSPVTEAQVVVGKFAAAMAFYAALWLPTALYVLVLRRHSEIDIGPVLAGYLGVFLLGFFFPGSRDLLLDPDQQPADRGHHRLCRDGGPLLDRPRRAADDLLFGHQIGFRPHEPLDPDGRLRQGHR